MYFIGKKHLDSTLGRMKPVDKPTAGEVYSDAALCRARNTYYAAALLYREGHMIEAHAMSRLILEQIAWAFSVRDASDFDEAKKISPTKAIGNLKKVIPRAGKLYGLLSNYVHLPIGEHFNFVRLDQEHAETIFRFGAHSYRQGTVISELADYWASIYEYTQARHYDHLENWTDTANGLTLNPDRPFLQVIVPAVMELKKAYERDYPSYTDFIAQNWTVDEQCRDDN